MNKWKKFKKFPENGKFFKSTENTSPGNLEFACIRRTETIN